MAIKADMEKAYDRVEWPFLIILQQFDFHPTWINWISQCISSSIFSILLNGSPFGRFTLLGVFVKAIHYCLYYFCCA